MSNYIYANKDAVETVNLPNQNKKTTQVFQQLEAQEKLLKELAFVLDFLEMSLEAISRN